MLHDFPDPEWVERLPEPLRQPHKETLALLNEWSNALQSMDPFDTSDFSQSVDNFWAIASFPWVSWGSLSPVEHFLNSVATKGGEHLNGVDAPNAHSLTHELAARWITALNVAVWEMREYEEDPDWESVQYDKNFSADDWAQSLDATRCTEVEEVTPDLTDIHTLSKAIDREIIQAWALWEQVPGLRPSTAAKQDFGSGDIARRMKETLEGNPEAKEWSIPKWAEHLHCDWSGVAVLKTRGGRTRKWDHYVDWCDAYKHNNPGTTDAQARKEYISRHKTREVPGRDVLRSARAYRKKKDNGQA